LNATDTRKEHRPDSADGGTSAANVWHLWEDRCKGCGICIEFCPTKALEFSKELSTKGYYVPVLEEKKCTYCGICDLYCPDLAIMVVRGKKTETQTA